MFDFPAYVHDVSKKFTHNLEKVQLDPPAPHECPGLFEVEHTRIKTFGSLIKLTNRLFAVEEDLKAVVEKLEPNVHQFWPIAIIMPNGDPYPKQYYGLRIGQFLDSFVPEESNEGAWRERNGRFRVQQPNKKFFAGLAMSRDAVGVAHLWRETRLRQPEVSLSDALHSEIEKAGLKMPKLYKLKDAP